jgi:hypothetical protein
MRFIWSTTSKQPDGSSFSSYALESDGTIRLFISFRPWPAESTFTLTPALGRIGVRSPNITYRAALRRTVADAKAWALRQLESPMQMLVTGLADDLKYESQP